MPMIYAKGFILKANDLKRIGLICKLKAKIKEQKLKSKLRIINFIF